MIFYTHFDQNTLIIITYIVTQVLKYIFDQYKIINFIDLDF